MTGPDYQRPKVDVPAQWRVEAPAARDTADTKWWEQFGDPVLNDLVWVALRENKDLLMATARVDQYLGQFESTRGALFPQLGAGVSAGGERYTRNGTTKIPVGKVTYGAYSALGNASWEIDLWGKLRRSTEAARADLLGSEESRRGVILTLVSAVAGSYVNLRDLDRQLLLARETAKSYGDSYKLFQLKFEGGVISEVDLMQVKSQYEDALATIPQIEKAIGQQEDAICLLLGRNPGRVPRGRTIDQLTLPAVPAGLPSKLLIRRPDIRAAEQTLIAANARIGVARSAYFPSISLTGAMGFGSTDLSNLFGGASRVWSWSAPLTAPIFTGGQIRGSVKAAEAFQREMLINYQQVIQTAFAEVNDALIDQSRTRERLAAQARQVAALQNYAELARLRYDNGYTSYLEVLDAQNTLFAVQLSYVQTKGVLFQSLANLYKAMGGGWMDGTGTME